VKAVGVGAGNTPHEAHATRDSVGMRAYWVGNCPLLAVKILPNMYTYYSQPIGRGLTDYLPVKTPGRRSSMEAMPSSASAVVDNQSWVLRSWSNRSRTRSAKP
jgi:hypothetical protein